MPPKKAKRSAASTPKPPQDFKRLKAKVGKRAPNAINATDATFKSSQLRMTTQHSSTGLQSPQITTTTDASSVFSSVLLPSKSGKSLPTLLQTLRNPSSSIKSSALSQMHDIVTDVRNALLLHRHLGDICGKIGEKIVDDNGSVREGGLKVFEGLLRNIRDNNSSINVGIYLGPFVPLLVAYITSGMNSLDSDTRIDAVNHLGVLVDFVGRDGLGDETVMERVLAGFGGVMKGLRGKQREKVLRVLGGVLRCGVQSSSTMMSSLIQNRNVMALNGGFTLFRGFDGEVNPDASHLLDYLASATPNADASRSNPRNSSKKTKTTTYSYCPLDLFLHLRDQLIELLFTDRSKTSSNSSSNSQKVSASSLQLSSLMLSCMHLFAARYGHLIDDDLAVKTGRLLMEVLEKFESSADRDGDGDRKVPGLSEADEGRKGIREGAVVGMVELCGGRGDCGNKVDWREAVINFVSWSTNDLGNDKLKLLTLTLTSPTLPPATKLSIMSSFFDNNKDDIYDYAARGKNGGKLAAVVARVLEEEVSRGHALPEQLLPRCVELAVFSLVGLVSDNVNKDGIGDHDRDEVILREYILIVLTQVVRYLPRLSSSSSPLPPTVSFVDDVVTKSILPVLSKSNKQIPFEHLPSTVKTITIDMISLLISFGRQTEAIAEKLGTICGRKVLENNLKERIAMMMDNIRMDLKLSSYLNFLILSLGISGKKQKDSDTNVGMHVDLVLELNLERVCRSLSCLGPIGLKLMNKNLKPVILGHLGSEKATIIRTGILMVVAAVSTVEEFETVLSDDIKSAILAGAGKLLSIEDDAVVNLLVTLSSLTEEGKLFFDLLALSGPRLSVNELRNIGRILDHPSFVCVDKQKLTDWMSTLNLDGQEMAAVKNDLEGAISLIGSVLQ